MHSIRLSWRSRTSEYIITEEAADQNGYETSATAQIGTVGADKVVRGTLTDNESVTYTNTRESVVPTGTDRSGWVLLALMLFVALAAMYVRRRRMKDTL